MAEIVLGRLKFKWQGPWDNATDYIKDDVVGYGGNSYVCISNHTSSSSFSTDLADNKWDVMLEGGTPTTTEGDMIFHNGDSNERLPIGNEGQALIVHNGRPVWTGLATAQNIYYVKADGSDDNDGSNLNQAFRTINYALSQITGPATLHVSVGNYYEILPLVVPANVTIIGDGQRSTNVAPLVVSSLSADVVQQLATSTSTEIIVTDADTTGEFTVGCKIDGTGIDGNVTVTAIEADTPIAGLTTLTVSFSAQTVTADSTDITSDYSQGTMWQLNDGAVLNKMYFSGMTGFEPSISSPDDITDATIAGVFVAFDPAHPIVTKSPYVIECACFSEGGIGAVVDGDVHGSGIRSMVFHGYTTINSNGVGYWVNGAGKAEIVSCFTYYCYFGYTTTGGGRIRALNGNNSYGQYGSVSRGYLATEIPNTGAIYGDQLEYDVISLIGGFAEGDTITGGDSETVGTVTDVQVSNHKVYYKKVSGPGFLEGESISNGSGASASISTGGVTGQKGYIIVVDGLDAEPKIGGSIQITGDSQTYVIQSFSGTYTNSSSVLVIVLAQEKIAASVDGTVIEIRYEYSQTRLTGHDFLSVGTGGKTTTNYPGTPTQPADQANEVVESYPGRVFYVSTDQDGNFRVGEYFKVDQATGKATLNATAFDLSGLSSLRLGSIGAQLGAQINEFSTDETLSGNSNLAVPTEHAVKAYFEQVTSDFLPAVDLEYDLGSSSFRWKELHVGAGSIYLGTVKLEDDNGTLKITSGGNPAGAAINAIGNGTSSVSVAVNGAVTVAVGGSTAATFGSGGTLTTTGTLNVNSANGIVTNQTTFPIANTTATTVNFAGAATTVNIGASTGTTTIKNDLDVNGDLQVKGGDLTASLSTFNLVNTHVTTLNVASEATTISVGAATGTTTFNSTTASTDHTTGAVVIKGGLGVDGTSFFGGDLQVTGDILFGGEANQLSATQLNIDDPMVYLAHDNPADILDLGILAAYNDGAHKHAGIVRDHSDNTWKFFTGLTVEPGNTVSWGSVTYSDVKMGGLIATGHVTLEGVTSTGATGTGKLVFDNAPTISGHPTIEGVTSTGATGTGNLVFDTSPTLTTPTLGAATATSINGLTISSSTGTLTITNGKTVSVSNTLTFTGTDSSSVAFGAGGTVAYTSNKLSAFASTSSSELAGVISDETGSGALVFATSPTLTTPVLGVATATSINKLAITAPTSSATLTIADGSSLITSGAYSITLTATGATNITLPTSGTLMTTTTGATTGKAIAMAMVFG